MSMYKCTSLVTAEAVTDKAMQIINSAEGSYAGLSKIDQNEFRIYIESYQNGREQGHLVWPMFAAQLAYYVCEPRSTDGVRIYRGAYAMQSISKDAYAHSHSFETVDQAADWLVMDLVALFLSKEKK